MLQTCLKEIECHHWTLFGVNDFSLKFVYWCCNTNMSLSLSLQGSHMMHYKHSPHQQNPFSSMWSVVYRIHCLVCCDSFPWICLRQLFVSEKLFVNWLSSCVLPAALQYACLYHCLCRLQQVCNWEVLGVEGLGCLLKCFITVHQEGSLLWHTSCYQVGSFELFTMNLQIHAGLSPWGHFWHRMLLLFTRVMFGLGRLGPQLK